MESRRRTRRTETKNVCAQVTKDVYLLVCVQTTCPKIHLHSFGNKKEPIVKSALPKEKVIRNSFPFNLPLSFVALHFCFHFYCVFIFMCIVFTMVLSCLPALRLCWVFSFFSCFLFLFGVYKTEQLLCIMVGGFVCFVTECLR